ncbi:hypothetical protein SAMN05661008_01645 [Alkalithermobacter thermoalcaliphilus JW-YL-7 = DSM 7308]|uniref:Uncharacterized protein n=1 Tax=Alkalithermobacter thermoalcaliphilus JW-YL-7 = DSM 7308 TaxID=1121328 RepID=A0A150FSP6_CLOPD|nr:hypothetical protein JWYL7_1699 [[Clostridium] paradoxum JW-YL-7 = DSM 7308]SHL19676.1 hypothetical protein SAMN05661008_01645 [[Clostridium] paradoxum JW-YL-7 = DSM 7308]
MKNNIIKAYAVEAMNYLLNMGIITTDERELAMTSLALEIDFLLKNFNEEEILESKVYKSLELIR